MKYLLGIICLLQVACSMKSQPSRLHDSLIQLKSNMAESTSPDLVSKGEKALQIFDETGYIEAQELADAGLESITWESLDEALMFFEMALEKDRGNEKALFYLSILRPITFFKGIIWRSNSLEGWSVEKLLYKSIYTLKNERGVSFYRYLSTNKFGQKFKSRREVVKKFIEPFTKELARSYDLMQILLSNPELDFKANLPEIFFLAEDIRIRHADMRMIQTLYRQYYLFMRLWTAYNDSAFEGFDSRTIGTNSDSYSLEDRPFDLKDPLFGVLNDPHVFRMLKDDTLGLIDSLEQVDEELKARFLNDENDPNDFVQANAVSIATCHSALNRGYVMAGGVQYGITEVNQEIYFNPNLESENKVGSCNFPKKYILETNLTYINLAQREYFSNIYDGKHLTQREDLEQYNEMVSYAKDLYKRDDLTRIRNLLLMPTEDEVSCGSKEDGFKVEKFVVDFPAFTEHPVADLKLLKPKFLDKGFSQIYYLEDPTFGGLYKPAYPCYRYNQELARKKGLLK